MKQPKRLQASPQDCRARNRVTVLGTVQHPTYKVGMRPCSCAGTDSNRVIQLLKLRNDHLSRTKHHVGETLSNGSQYTIIHNGQWFNSQTDMLVPCMCM